MQQPARRTASALAITLLCCTGLTMTLEGCASSSAPAAAPAMLDPEQRLVRLKHLYAKGLITKAEYDRKRAEILKAL